jgi:excisionase family DNA binding protein
MASIETTTAEEPMKVFDVNRNYRPDEVATALRVSRKTVYRWIRDIANPLRAFRTTENGQLRCSGKDLNQYVLKNQVKPEYE